MKQEFSIFIVVTPHAGVWIETCVYGVSITPTIVTPHAGVWIETLSVVV